MLSLLMKAGVCFVARHINLDTVLGRDVFGKEIRRGDIVLIAQDRNDFVLYVAKQPA